MLRSASVMSRKWTGTVQRQHAAHRLGTRPTAGPQQDVHDDPGIAPGCSGYGSCKTTPARSASPTH